MTQFFDTGNTKLTTWTIALETIISIVDLFLHFREDRRGLRAATVKIATVTESMNNVQKKISSDSSIYDGKKNEKVPEPSTGRIPLT